MSAATSAVALATDESAGMQQQVVPTTTLASEEQRRSDDYYDIPGTLAWVRQHAFSVVALQLPDELVADAAWLTHQLSSRATDSSSGDGGCKFVVLADTAYGACCVDVVAAQHAEASAIVHYGRACMTLTSKLPVRYVFGQEPFDVEALLQQIQQQQELLGDKPVVVMDPRFQWRGPVLEQAGVAVAPVRDTESRHTVLASASAAIWVGEEALAQTNLMMCHNTKPWWRFSPTSSTLARDGTGVNKLLMRRYYLVQKAREARIFGVLIGTLGAEHFLDVVTRIQGIIRTAQRKYYTVLVGKLSDVKLGNFAEVEVFVLVACPENLMLDTRDYYQAVLTPYELELALVRGREWDGTYATDLASVLTRAEDEAGGTDVINDNDDEDTLSSAMQGSSLEQAEDQGGYRMSLISGRIVEDPKSLAMRQAVRDSTAVTVMEGERAVGQVIGSAAEYLTNRRSYTGLQQRIGQDDAHAATEGRAGIARGYAVAGEGEGVAGPAAQDDRLCGSNGGDGDGVVEQ